MDYKDFLDKELTLHTESKDHRGILRKIIPADGAVQLEVGPDTLYIRVDVVHAVTVHWGEVPDQESNNNDD